MKLAFDLALFVDSLISFPLFFSLGNFAFDGFSIFFVLTHLFRVFNFSFFPAVSPHTRQISTSW